MSPPVLRTIAMIAGLFVTMGSAHAAPPTQVPWTESTFERANGRLGFDPGAVAPRADLFDPLWALGGASFLPDLRALATASIGEAVDGVWSLDGLRLEVADRDPGARVIILRRADLQGPALTEQLLPGLSVLAAVGAPSCREAVQAIGRPSAWVERSGLAWDLVDNGREMTVEIACAGDEVRALAVAWRELADARVDVAVSEPRALPKGFSFRTLVADPKRKGPGEPLRWWPKGLAPGTDLDGVVQRWGAPSYGRERQRVVAGSVVVEFDDRGRVTKVSVPLRAKGAIRQAGLEEGLLATLGEPFARLEALLGPPSLDHRVPTWLWIAEGPTGRESFSISAERESVEDDGPAYVGSLVFERIGPGGHGCTPESTADLRAARADAKTPPVPNVLGGGVLVVPFGLPASPRAGDVFAALGEPDRCSFQKLSYPGVEVALDGDARVTELTLHPEAVLYFGERARKGRGAPRDPVVEALRVGPRPLDEVWGPETPARHDWRFELGALGVQALTLASDDATIVISIAWEFEAYDYAGKVQGLALRDLPTTVPALLGPGESTWGGGTRWGNGAITLEVERDVAPVLKITDHAIPFLTAHGVGGALVKALGTPWTEVIRRFGEPIDLAYAKGVLSLGFGRATDPLDRMFIFRCAGTTPVCSEVEVRVGPPTVHEEEAP